MVKSESREVISCSSRANKTKQYSATFIASIAQLALGSCYGYISPALPSLLKEEAFKNLNEHEISFIGSAFNIGAIVGMIVGGLSSEKFGRKRCIFISSLPFVLSWMLIALANNVAMVYAGRFLTGVWAGFLTPCCRVYILEVVQPKLRGFLAAVPGIAITLGILFSYLVGNFLNWRMTAACCSAIPLSLFITSLIIPESPVWLLKKGSKNLSKAEKNLLWLRGKHFNIEREFQTMQDSAERTVSEKSLLTELFRRQHLIPLVICLYLMTSIQFSGFSIVVYFAFQLLTESRSVVSPKLGTILIGVMQFGVTSFSSFLLYNRYGRKPILSVSCALTSCCLFLFGLYLYFEEYEGRDVSHVSWMPFAVLMAYTFSSNIGLVSIPWILNAELYPLRIRGTAAGIGAAVMQLTGFIVVQISYPLKTAIGTYGMFWLFAIVAALAVPVIFWFVPETKGVGLDEIEKIFTKKSNKDAVVSVTRF